ncbi:ATP-binding protein [Aspergillus brunneoviolaceus CBS 621.78]|uniref:Uncharacterized protein n=1 Tax=Aspergillus brunneoviolaceus CBS 621.78 TaxID=1450534 RepID=A0ACD1GFP4_9EURO|nr:hypothetical protein BO95DRAFT_451361 [Aspergillus brunneoviolaceus CBS 621.78]RAH48047.1 hypothetical protein BO95DRAFT_451361 [Aspergillus brunneoviolaceus CBS 621.78]
METAATTFASLAILGLAGYAYHRYYKYLILEKMENAFNPGDPALEIAGIEEGKHRFNHEEHWVVRDEQARIDRIVSGLGVGRYYLLVGEKGTGKTSMILEAMRKINGEGCAMFEAHGDLEIFRIRLGKALDYEFHEDYIGSLFSIKGPRDTTALLDIERAFNKLEKVALTRRRTKKSPLILIVNSAHLVRDDHDGQDLLEVIQQRAEQWAASGLVTTILNSDDYWVYERLKRYATRMEVIPVKDLPKEPAMEALKRYRKQYFGEELSPEDLEKVYDAVGGRLSFLNRVAKAPDYKKLCQDICTAEKTWFLNKCWILGPEMDDDVMDQQKYASAAMVLAKALVEEEKKMKHSYHPELGHILPEIPLHEARQIMTRADFVQSYDHENIFTIDSRAMVRADSVPMQNAFREICNWPGFDEHLEGTLTRIGDIESLGRTRELTIKDLWNQGKYQLVMRDSKGREQGAAEFSVIRTMSPRKKEVLSSVTITQEPSASAQPHHKTQLERIPPPARFLLAVVSSLALSSGLFTLMPIVTRGELGNVSKHLETWWEVGGLMAWKAVEVGLAWILGYDSHDVCSFTFLTHLPTYSLLSTFYGVRPTTILASYAITILSTVLPFTLLRRPNSFHDLAHASPETVSNRLILQDRATTAYTTMVATAIFTVALYLSYATPWLPTNLVLHFEGIPDISAVHAGPAGLPALFLTLLPAGFAARDFLFASSTGASAASDKKTERTEKTTKPSTFTQDGEYLACAVYRKTWGTLSPKTQVLVSRTVVLAGMLLANTVIQVAGTVNRVSVEGASVWGLVWAAAALVNGLMFGWIESVDGV